MCSAASRDNASSLPRQHAWHRSYRNEALGTSPNPSHNQHYPFELPKGWEWTTLGEVISIKSGNAIKVRNNKNGSFPIYGGNGISGYSDEYNIDKPTIVIGRVGFYCGSIHYVKSKAWVTDNAFITSIYGNVYDIDFLYYLLTYCNLRQYSNSTAQPVISGKTIYPVHVPVPPIKEQRKIVEKIEFWLSCISQLEFSQSKVKSTIKQAKSKILDLAIHGKLVQQDPNDEPASELLKRINPKAEITCDTPQYGKLPKGWCETTLGNTIVIKSGDAIKVRDNRIGKYPIYGGNGITGYNESYNVDGINIIIGRVGFYCGSVHYVDNKIWVTDNAFVTKIMGNVYTPKFLYYLLQQYDLKQYSNSTAQPVISGKTVYPINVMLPPLSEQYRIVARIEELFAQLDKIESSLQA